MAADKYPTPAQRRAINTLKRVSRCRPESLGLGVSLIALAVAATGAQGSPTGARVGDVL